MKTILKHYKHPSKGFGRKPKVKSLREAIAHRQQMMFRIPKAAIKAAEKVLEDQKDSPALPMIHALQESYQSKVSDTINEIIDLKKRLLLAEETQREYQKRVIIIENFTKDEDTILISKWLTE